MKHGGDIYNNRIELDFSVNKNPLALPVTVRDAINRALEQIGNYPEYDYKRLIKALADLEGCDSGQIVCGNGASEIFMGIIHTLNPAKALLIQPGFYGYEYVLEACGCEIMTYHVYEKNNFMIGEDYLDMLSPQLDMIFLGNPNNPTGRFINEDLLTAILEKAKSLNIIVVLDECFYLLGKKQKDTGNNAHERSRINMLIANYPNLIVVKAFTKLFAIPGIRIGYSICSEELAERLKMHIPEWNVSVIADEVGRACCDVLQNTDYRTYTLDMLGMSKEYLIGKLRESKIRVYESDVNFVLIKADRNLGKKLLSKGILVRDCKNYNGLGEGFYRISVQDRKNTDKLIAAINEICM